MPVTAASKMQSPTGRPSDGPFDDLEELIGAVATLYRSVAYGHAEAYLTSEHLWRLGELYGKHLPTVEESVELGDEV